MGTFVWDQSGIRIIGIVRVSVCLGAILVGDYLDFHSSYSAPRNIFLFRNIPNECALSIIRMYGQIMEAVGLAENTL